MAFSAESGAAAAADAFREAVCINTRRIYDACGDRDCCRNLQVAFSAESQELVESASAIKARRAEAIGVFFEVEPVAFNRGFYSVDMTYYFKVSLSAYTAAAAAPQPIEGLASYCKKVILFGSEASVKTFSTERPFVADLAGLPIVNAQVIDPMVLSCDVFDCEEERTRAVNAPEEILAQFEGTFDGVSYTRGVNVSVGLFSIVQLERQVQVMVPIYDFCVPESSAREPDDDPCELFGRIAFPTEEFFPPKLADLGEED